MTERIDPREFYDEYEAYCALEAILEEVGPITLFDADYDCEI